jgi:hypothetical protein
VLPNRFRIGSLRTCGSIRLVERLNSGSGVIWFDCLTQLCTPIGRNFRFATSCAIPSHRFAAAAMSVTNPIAPAWPVHARPRTRLQKPRPFRASRMSHPPDQRRRRPTNTPHRGRAEIGLWSYTEGPSPALQSLARPRLLSHFLLHLSFCKSIPNATGMSTPSKNIESSHGRKTS